MRFKRSSLLTKVLILVLVVYATVTLVSLESQVAEKNAEAAELEHSIDAAKQENLRLEQAIETLDTDGSPEDGLLRGDRSDGDGQIPAWDDHSAAVPGQAESDGWTD